MKKAMAELLGKRTGFCKGKGGSMHLADFSIGILGESGILGSAIPTAVGAALGSQLQGNDRVAVSFFGDGASNEGVFHESINLAAIWKLPVIFLCENNQYAVTSSFKTMVASENISDRAASYAIPGVLVDGQDVLAMHEAVSHAVERARAGQGPSLIEGRTYRYYDHWNRKSCSRSTRRWSSPGRARTPTPLSFLMTCSPTPSHWNKGRVKPRLVPYLEIAVSIIRSP